MLNYGQKSIDEIHSWEMTFYIKDSSPIWGYGSPFFAIIPVVYAPSEINLNEA